jgi:hypothetical protein
LACSGALKLRGGASDFRQIDGACGAQKPSPLMLLPSAYNDAKALLSFSSPMRRRKIADS